MAEEKEILDVVNLLASVYRKEPGDMRGFYWTLADVPLDILQDSAQDWVKREKWMPAPSELLSECQPRMSKRSLWGRMNAAFNAVASGKEKDERIVNAVFDYYQVGVRPDIPSKPDTRTDAEIEKEWQEWKRQNADHDALKYHGPTKPRR